MINHPGKHQVKKLDLGEHPRPDLGGDGPPRALPNAEPASEALMLNCNALDKSRPEWKPKIDVMAPDCGLAQEDRRAGDRGLA